jgi:hypothetical protein
MPLDRGGHTENTTMANSDLELAVHLLHGRIEEDAGGRFRWVYLEEGTARERDARRALAKLLRSKDPLDEQIRYWLAGLFDPQAIGLEQRKISFTYRNWNRPTDHAAGIHVFIYINDLINFAAKKYGAKAAAIKAAATKFSISEEKAKRYWLDYSRVYGLRSSRNTTVV